MIERFGPDRCSGRPARKPSGSSSTRRCIYTYFGGSYIELPAAKTSRSSGDRTAARPPRQEDRADDRTERTHLRVDEDGFSKTR